MRKPFRTTIEEDILQLLKKTAIEQGVHVNDIIERLVIDKIHEEYFNKELSRLPSMTSGERQFYLERRLTRVIRDSIDEMGLFEKPYNLSEIIAKTVASIVFSDEMFPKKK